jgi:AcrR family transcriptional regulator
MATVTRVSSSLPEQVRRELLRRAADYVLAHGLADASLRPLAAALGTSGRMLIYYFGSKEQLVLEVLAEVRRRKYDELRLTSGDNDVLRRYWTWAVSAEGQRYLRLVYEVYGLSLRHPARFGDFLARESEEVLAVIESSYRSAGVPSGEAASLATYTFAALRGLELDVLASGDARRVERAFEMLEEDLTRRMGESTREAT